jgi:hypothetical protein
VKKGGFRMNDTPGTNSNANSLHHALLLRSSLASLKINLMMVAFKLEARFQKTFSEI